MFLTAKKSAELMGISAKTLYRLCHEGKVSFLRVGTQKLLFDSEKLKEELQALMTPAKDIEG